MKNIKSFKQFNEEISHENSNSNMFTYSVTFDVVAGSESEAEEKLYSLESNIIDLGLFQKVRQSSESTITYKVDVTVVASSTEEAEASIENLNDDVITVIDMKYDQLVNKEEEVIAESRRNRKKSRSK